MFNYFQYKLFEKNIYLKIFETLTLSSSFSSWNSKCVEIYVLLYCASPAIFIVWRLPNNFCFRVKYILRIEIKVRFWQIHCGSYVNEFHIKTKSVRNSVHTILCKSIKCYIYLGRGSTMITKAVALKPTLFGQCALGSRFWAPLMCTGVQRPKAGSTRPIVRFPSGSGNLTKTPVTWSISLCYIILLQSK